jgi:deazaflavin-dependent oxidoreductase (nitroreductase family)
MSTTNQTLQPRKIGPVTNAMQRFMTGLHIFCYHLSGGAIGGRMMGCPVLLLTTVGRKSGKARTVPLFYLPDGDCYVLVASNGGAATHPLWYRNLLANPQIQIEVGRQKFSATPEQATSEERARLWPLLVAMYPSYADYQKRTSREIPLVILRRS